MCSLFDCASYTPLELFLYIKVWTIMCQNFQPLSKINLINKSLLQKFNNSQVLGWVVHPPPNDFENQTWYGPETFTSNTSGKLMDKNGAILFVTWLLCNLQTRIGKIQTFYIFGSTNGIDLKLTPVVGLDKRRWFVTSLWRHHDVTMKMTSLTVTS